MSRRKPDAFDRAVKALAKVGGTRSGRKFLRELGRDHSPAMQHCLADLIGKP